MNRINDTAVGLGTAALGSGGLTWQAIEEGLNLAILAGNLALVVGGLVLLGCRLRKVFRR